MKASPMWHVIRIMVLTLIVEALGISSAIGQTTRIIEGRSLEQGITNLLNAIDLIGPLATLVRLEVSTLPLGTSSGGLTFIYDPTTDQTKRRSSMFGPMFGDRAITTGTGRLVVGTYNLHASYHSLGGYDLRSGALRPFINVEQSTEGIVSTSVTLSVSSNSQVAYAHYGITRDVDAGVAVPWLTVQASGAGRFLGTRGQLLSTNVLLPTTASGIGDVALFAKYNFWHHRRSPDREQVTEAAFTIESRVPTGRTEALRGLGVWRTAVAYVVSSEFKRLSPHAAVGFELWSRGVKVSKFADWNTKDRVKWTFGVDVNANPRLTLNFDGLASATTEGGSLEYFHFTPSNSATTFDELVAMPTGVVKIDLASGMRWNVMGNVIVSANVLVSLHNRGLRSTLSPVVGIEWAPSR